MTWSHIMFLLYQELVALGEVIGSASRGLSADRIASLPSVNFKAGSMQDGNTDQYVQALTDF